MRVFYSDEFELPLPSEHRFPMVKYRLLRERVEATALARSLEVPPAASDDQLLTVHDSDYLRRVVGGELTAAEIRRLGFPWSPQLVERSRRSVGGTLAAARAALDEGAAVNLAGGTHHAFADRAEAYCVFNDVAVATGVLLRECRIERALVVDCDVHQGNGTASIFADEPRVFTLSLHGARNYPLRKEESDLDVAFADGTEDSEYLGALSQALEEGFRRSRPELVLFVSGADPYVGDRLGRLALSQSGLERRDAMVVSKAVQLGVPIAAVMAGGYCPHVEEIVDIHATTVSAMTRACCAS